MPRLRQLAQPPSLPPEENDKFTPLGCGVSGAGLGFSLGLASGLFSGVIPALGRGVVGCAGGVVAGALVGAAVAKVMRPKEEWAALDGVKLGVLPGGAAGAVLGLLSQASTTSALVLGAAGAAAGGALGLLAYEVYFKNL